MRRNLNLKERQQAVQSLWTAVNEGGSALNDVPEIVKTVLVTEAWKERQDGERIYRHDSFRQFIESDPRAGCGWSIDKVEKLIRDDPDVLAMWRDAIKEQGARNDLNFSDNITEVKAKTGTSRAYTLDRLSREAPELYQAVCDGELSANAAAIEAGFRKKPTPFEQVQKLLPKLTDEERRQLRELL